MLRIIIAGLFIATLTGCSELQIIGRAAVKELQAEAINVEWLAYQQREEAAASKTIQPTIVAKAEPKALAGRNQAKRGSNRKGLWEGR